MWKGVREHERKAKSGRREQRQWEQRGWRERESRTQERENMGGREIKGVVVKGEAGGNGGGSRESRDAPFQHPHLCSEGKKGTGIKYCPLVCFALLFLKS